MAETRVSSVINVGQNCMFMPQFEWGRDTRLLPRTRIKIVNAQFSQKLILSHWDAWDHFCSATNLTRFLAICDNFY